MGIAKMNEINNPFNQDRTIGDNGESAVSFLISLVPNWKCIKFGVENHMADLKEIVRKEINPITKKIKSMPDFVAFNTKTGDRTLIWESQGLILPKVVAVVVKKIFTNF